MADNEPAPRTQPAALGGSETGPSTNEALVAATMKTADKRSRVSLPETAVLFGVLAVLVIFFSITSQFFLNSANLINILRTRGAHRDRGCAATLLLIGGQFDLSVGSAAAFVAMVTAIRCGDIRIPDHAWPAPVCRAPGRVGCGPPCRAAERRERHRLPHQRLDHHVGHPAILRG